MRIERYTWVAGLGVVGLAIGVYAGSANSAERGTDAVPYSTPPGITLVDVTKFLQNSSDQFLWRRLGDAQGKPLYTYDKDGDSGKSSCVDDCAKEFPPFMAAKDAAAFGDWSFVIRDGNDKQWAYQGRPLYRYSGKDPVGEPVSGGLSTTGAENPDWHNPGSKVYSPKAGWTRAEYTPEKSIPIPAGIDLQSLAVANGYGFVAVNTGMTIYTLKGAPKTTDWQPVYAAELAAPVGDFTIVNREDATRQWAYKGERLYTFDQDYAPGDSNGVLAEKNAHVALASRHFMPTSVAVQYYPGRGPLMTTTKGLSLYTETRYHLQYGGREVRDGYRYTYNEAKVVGTKGCVSDCTETWHPLLAPAKAEGAGFWEVMDRPDGSKQWAYKGSALYTYTDDKKPGDIEGNNRHVIVYGDADGKIDLTITGGNAQEGRNVAGSGLYWHLVGMYY